MAAVSQKIPNLLGGVSQQPDPVKLPGQVRDATNIYLDPTFGARKRPPTALVATLATDVPEDAKWFTIYRDNFERYAVTMYYDSNDDFTLRVWEMNGGNERTVNISDVSKTYFQKALDSNDPDFGKDLSFISPLTVADYTLISNEKRSVTMNQAADPPANQSALVVLKTVAYNATYSIDLDGTLGQSTTDVPRATKISVSPTEVDVTDNGTCASSGTQEFLEDHPTDPSKTGLAFRLVVGCGAQGVNGEGGTIWYFSKMRATVQFRNGGEGWQVGDVVSVVFKGYTYHIRVDAVETSTAFNSDGSATYTTPANSDGGTLNISSIITDLTADINGLTNYTADSVGNCIKITKTNGEPFNVGVRGGVTDSSMEAYQSTAPDVAALPDQCFEGYIMKVINTAEADEDDYYVKFVTDNNGERGLGSWVETVKPGTPTNINAGSMPQALIRQADSTFELRPLQDGDAFDGWGAREVGDEDTNPDPSFVGRGISSMFFHANRLGFLTEDAVVLSQPGDYFNFFNVSALTVSDADPIDLTASSTTPAILKGAISAPKGLVLFAERSQFLLATNEIAFAASTVKLTEISNYYYKSTIDPLSTGISIAFPSENRTYTKILEMAVDSVENRPEVADITRILPEFLPSNLVWGHSLPNNNMLLYGDGSHNVYVFKFFNQGNERQIAGWTRWVFPQKVLAWGSEDDTSSIVAYDNGRHVLLRMELIDDSADAPLELSFSSFTPRLDSYVTNAHPGVVVTSYDTLFNKVIIPEDLRVAGVQYVLISTSPDYLATFVRPLYVVDGNDWYLIVEKTLSQADFYLGIEYEASVELPSIFLAQEGRSDRVNVPIVENLHLDLYYSGSYVVSIQKLGYPTQIMNLEVVAANIYDADEPPIQEISTLNVPIFSRGDIVQITVRAMDPYPCSITGYSWEGHYNNRGITPIR